MNKTQKKWKSKKEDISAWLFFFLEIVNLQASKALTILEGASIEYVLSPKQLALWNWALSLESKEFSRKDAVASLQFSSRTVEASIKKLAIKIKGCFSLFLLAKLYQSINSVSSFLTK